MFTIRIAVKNVTAIQLKKCFLRNTIPSIQRNNYFLLVVRNCHVFLINIFFNEILNVKYRHDHTLSVTLFVHT